MPEKGNKINKGIDDTGLHKRPQMMQIVNYLENGQEKMTYPDREAKFIRNHPFMTQLDFFDMQEDQQRGTCQGIGRGKHPHEFDPRVQSI